MTVQVSPGNYQCGRSGLGAFLGAVTGNTSATIGGSNGSNPRIDYVIIRVKEPVTDGTVAATAQVIVLPGTPAANPSETTAASQMIDGDLLLAAVTVRAGTTTILQSDIIDKRVYAKARSGIGVKSAVDSTSGSYPGDWRDNLATNTLERWSGSAWQPVATPATWLQYTPRLVSTGTGTDISIGTGASYLGHYTQVGKMLTLNLSFVWGAAPFNGGYGSIYSLLPSGFTSGSNPQWIQCHARFGLPVGAPTAYTDLQGQALIPANSTQIQPWFPVTIGGAVSPAPILSNAPYTIAAQQSQSGSGVPQITGGFPEGGYLHLTGLIEIV